MRDRQAISGYGYKDSNAGHAHAYLLPPVTSIISDHFSKAPEVARKVFDLGCGNGSVASHLDRLGFRMSGVDPSDMGIRQANTAFPELSLHVGSGYDPLAEQYGQFPVVISLEVIEHVYAPRDFAKTVYDLVEPHGIAIISTPYHSYMKNLALALSGSMDRHFTALWDHGHIKFWSVKTLSDLFEEQRMVRENVIRVGRFPVLAKSMILVFRKP